MEVEVVVEVPKGSRNKYEIDELTGVVHLDRQLFTATQYPADYGFVPDTLAEDGDAVDALVLVNEPTFPGCHIRCRVLGILRMTDEAGVDAKVLCAPASDPRMVWRELTDVPDFVLSEIRHFFEIYKELEPGKSTQVGDWDNRQSAEEYVRAAELRLASSSPDRR